MHGFCGIWGTLSLGLFATGQFGAPAPTGADNSAAAVVTGLFYGGGSDQLVAQIIGSASVTAATFGVGMALMYAVKLDRHACASPRKASSKGIDLHEHGGPAYPELIGGISGVGGEEAAPAAAAPVRVPAAAAT